MGVRDNIWKAFRYVLSVSVAAVLVYFAFRGTDWKAFLDGLAGTDWRFIILSVVAALAALWFREERWRCQLVLLDPAITRFSVWHGSNVGNLLNVVLPGAGEFTRCAYVSTKKAGYDRTLGTILMERSWDVLAIVLLLVLAMVTNRETIVPFMQENVLTPFMERFNFSLWWVVAAVALAAGLAVWLVFRLSPRNAACARLAGWIKGISNGFASFGKMEKKPLFIFYTVVIWVMYILMTYFTFKAVPGLTHLSFTDAVFISAIGNIASVIPTPGNIGPYHYLVGLSVSTVYLHSSAMTATGLLCATLSHGTHAILIIILGIESYIRISFKKKTA